MKRIIHFLRYDNIALLLIGILFLGAGSAFAATDPGVIYSSTDQVMSIDNTYLVNKDFASWMPSAEIAGVTEDADTYYVSYAFHTIDLKDSVWQDVSKDEMMKVSKADLGPYRDLGVYVTAQLNQQINRELAYLKETQSYEEKNVSNKVVATTYGGLVGKLLDGTTETLPGYTPVIVVPSEEGNGGSSASAAASQGSGGYVASTVSSGGAPRIEILGNNPARIPLWSVYLDLGAIVNDDKDMILPVTLHQDGKPMDMIAIDTSTTSVTTITYSVTDSDGNTATAERTVEVYDPYARSSEAASSTPVLESTSTAVAASSTIGASQQ